DSPTTVPTPTTIRVVQTTPVPTINRHLHTVSTAPPSEDEATATADPLALVPACSEADVLPLARHVVDATLVYREQVITVEQTTTYVNRTGEALAQVVFNVEPNRRPGVFTLQSLTLADDTPVPAYEL